MEGSCKSGENITMNFYKCLPGGALEQPSRESPLEILKKKNFDKEFAGYS